tara:strand:- start:90 stop:929 length:840 start_codon:yes stop_codon:yes gene_type:complete
MWVWSKLSPIQWEDAWEERFHGNPNVVLTRLKGGRSVRVEVYCDEESEAIKVAEQFGGRVRKLEDKNWMALTATPGPPIKIRGSLLVTPEVDPSRIRELVRIHGGRTVVRIPAEMAFGTGDHPTTASCLRFLADEAESHRGRPWRMLDLGCGSGVLAIAANLLGAEECDAIDHDAKAVAVAWNNVDRNKARGVTVTQEDLLQWVPVRQYEVVVANLFADVLEASFGKIGEMLDPAGAFILSGVLREQWTRVEAQARKKGLAFSEVTRKGKWVSARGGFG